MKSQPSFPAVLLSIVTCAAGLAVSVGAGRAGEEPWRSPLAGRVSAPFSSLVPLDRGQSAPDAVRPEGESRAWPQNTASTVVPPVFFDLDHDGTLDVIGGDDRGVFVFDHTGALRPGWPYNFGTGGPMMQAAVGDLDGDGSPEILIGRTYPGAMLYAFNTAGQVKDGWPVNLPHTNFGNVTCPVLVDLDGDGHMDAGVASELGVSFFDADGRPLPGWPYVWPVPINNPQWSAPAVGDMDGDGSLEVAVANANYPNWGVHVIRADGTVQPGWPKVIEPVFSSPALVDLDGDGRLEIIAQEGDPGSRGRRLWIWRHDGTVFPGWPRNIAADGMSSRCSPAVADVDGDGTWEIVTATADGNLHVLRSDGTYYPGYPRATGGVQPISSPAVIDVDGDGAEEMFLTYWLSNAQYVSGWRLDGSTLPGFPQLLFSGTDLNSHSSVHVADAEGDGHLDLTVSGSANNAGRIWVLPINPSVFAPATRADWPKMRRDSANLGSIARDPADVASPAIEESGGLRLVPNPATPRGMIALDLPGAGGFARQAGRITVLDAQGRVLRTCRLESGEALRLPAERIFGEHVLADGVYFLRWQADGDERGQSGRVVIRKF